MIDLTDSLIEYPPGRIAQRIRFELVDFLAQDVPPGRIRLTGIGVNPGIPEPPPPAAKRAGE